MEERRQATKTESMFLILFLELQNMLIDKEIAEHRLVQRFGTSNIFQALGKEIQIMYILMTKEKGRGKEPWQVICMDCNRESCRGQLASLPFQNDTNKQMAGPWTTL